MRRRTSQKSETRMAVMGAIKTPKEPMTLKNVVAWVKKRQGWMTRPTTETMRPPRRSVMKRGREPARSIPVETQFWVMLTKIWLPRKPRPRKKVPARQAEVYWTFWT